MGRAGKLRSGQLSWLVTASVLGVIITAGAAAVAKWPHAWWWLIVVTAVVAAATPGVLTTVSEIVQRRRETARTARAVLQGATGPGIGRLPATTNAPLEARVHPTVLAIPYI